MASGNEIILLEHGSGGQASQELLEEVFFPLLKDVLPLDSALLAPAAEGKMAFTTDTFVVTPIFFPGGDIGSLAVHGTINDLAMVGARPLYLSVAFILEEGLPLDTLKRVVSSLAEAARRAGVQVVCGDTKVVPRGKADQVFINTSGLGLVPPGTDVRPERIVPGDAIIVSGPIAEHGLAVLSAREDLGLEGLRSDSQPLHRAVSALLEELGPDLHALRDPTRGGLGSTLNELAEECRATFVLHEEALPLRPEVEAGCEILGLDPLYLACEGRFVAFVAPERAEDALAVLKRLPETDSASVVGEVVSGPPRVLLRTRYGGTRVVTRLRGEALPRIC
ncbi:MAG: hydrogenase expression/formation protein HypE [Thermodesulfobacteria bacterium]|nr:hydrogenase expression/formation protein HypE [Thermodesulfobacteriota bacterium]